MVKLIFSFFLFPFYFQLEAPVRFELTTSRFVILRSNSVELQSHFDLGF